MMVKMQHSVQRGFQGYCLSLSGGFSASRLLGLSGGFSASRLLGFSACPAASRLRGFSASRLLGLPGGSSASRLLGFSASRLVRWLLGFSASRLLGFLASRLVPGFSASRLLGFSACVVLRGFSASRLLGLCRASRLLGFSASGRISGPLLPVLCINGPFSMAMLNNQRVNRFVMNPHVVPVFLGSFLVEALVFPEFPSIPLINYSSVASVNWGHPTYGENKNTHTDTIAKPVPTPSFPTFPLYPQTASE